MAQPAILVDVNFKAVRAGSGLNPDPNFFHHGDGFQCTKCQPVIQYYFFTPNGLPAAFIEPHRKRARHISRTIHHPDHPDSFDMPFDPQLSA